MVGRWRLATTFGDAVLWVLLWKTARRRAFQHAAESMIDENIATTRLCNPFLDIRSGGQVVSFRHMYTPVLFLSTFEVQSSASARAVQSPIKDVATVCLH